ncbi:MAG: tRNA lysidine(34) synthetase TilS [Chitinophagaceae bacterium]
MLSRFIQYIKEKKLIHPHERLLVAVSGGVDSVLLARFCVEAGYQVTLAHCNFQLRGAESGRDEAFVRALADELQVPLLLRHFDTIKLAEETGKGIQELARDLRYDWFNTLITQGAERVADIILTAHHADDNIETVLMQFFRGTGLNGLCGMEPRQNKLVRPLLFARKSELLEYAKTNNIGYVEDSSNLSDKYTRNYFRHSVVPLLKDIYPQVENNLLENIHRFRDTHELHSVYIEKLRKKLIQPKGIPVLLLAKQPGLRTITYELLKPYGFSAAQVPEVLRLLDAQSGRQVQSSTHRIIRHRNWLVITEAKLRSEGILVVEEGEEQLLFAEGELSIENKRSPANWQPQQDASIAHLNSKEIKFPLIVRPWKAGDYFYPLGMKKKKKISRFLIDLKMPVHQKERVYVLESAGRIAWVIGYRIDERFKIKESTTSLLELRFSPLQ